MPLSLLLRLLEWFATRARVALDADTSGAPWTGPGTADRAGQLVPVPDNSFEPEVGRSLAGWWLWLAVGVVMLILAGGYIRRKLKAKGEAQAARSTWRAPR